MNRIIVAMLLCVVPLARAAEPIDQGPGKQPQVAISKAGHILVTFGRDNGIYFTLSTDGGRSFAPATLVAQPKFTPVGMRRGPRIAATKDAIVISAVVGELGGGKDGDVIVFRSTDGGMTWARSSRINRIETSAREGLIGLASDGDSRVVITWLDDRDKGKEVYCAFSHDAGKTFADDVRVYHSPDGHVCECCHPSAAFDGEGNCYIMFRNWLGGNRDMYVARSTNNGRSFDPAAKLGEGAWKLNACPMDGGGIDASGKEVETIWQRKGQIYRSNLAGAEHLLGDGTRPAISGHLIAWIDARRELMLCSSSDETPSSIAHEASDPSVASNAAIDVCAFESRGHCLICVNHATDATRPKRKR